MTLAKGGGATENAGPGKCRTDLENEGPSQGWKMQDQIIFAAAM